MSIWCFSLVLALVHLLSCKFAMAATSTTCMNHCGDLFGSCLCYCELEESLLATEDNTLDLTSTFFPAEDNPPEFVTVIYSFKDSNDTTIPGSQTWYWSAQTSYFLHPFEVFQFLSLFFGKPEPYYTGELLITLRAECKDISSVKDIDKLQLLTQRLKLYAERGNLGASNLILSDTYSAKAYNNSALMKVIEGNTNQIINIIICASIFVIFFSLIVVVILVITFFYSKSHTRSKWIENVKEKKPTVLSLTVLSGITNIYVISLASSAVGYWCNLINDKEDTLHSFDTRITAAPLFTAFGTDIIAFLVWIILVAAAGCIRTYYKEPNDGDGSSLWCTVHYAHCGECTCGDIIKHKHSCSMSSDNAFIILSLTVLCPIFCIIAHSPFIAIAYLNDGDHASSIFIYYTILCYMIFGVTWLFFHWCQHFIGDNNDKSPDAAVNEKKKTKCCFSRDAWKQYCCDRVLCCCTVGKIKRELPKVATSKEKKDCFITAVPMLLFVALLFLLGLIVVISCYFVLIPINKSISNAPNRLLSIYQSGGFLIGSFIVFNILKYFHVKNKKKDLGENVDKIHTILKNWLFHPRQQLHGLQEQLNKLEKQSEKFQQQLLKQPTCSSVAEEPTDQSTDSSRAHAIDTSSSSARSEPGGPPGTQTGDTSSAQQPGSQAPPQLSNQLKSNQLYSLQEKIHDLQEQLVQCMQQYGQLEQQIKESTNDPKGWVEDLGNKLKQLQQKLNGQEHQCQQQYRKTSSQQSP